MASTMDTDDLLRRCEQLAAAVAERTEEAEALRRLPDATMADVWTADLFRAVVPTSLGGHGLGLDALAQGTRRARPRLLASSWTLSFLMLHGWLLSRFPAAAASGAVRLRPRPAHARAAGAHRDDRRSCPTGSGSRAGGSGRRAWPMPSGCWCTRCRPSPSSRPGSSCCPAPRSRSTTCGSPRACGRRGATRCASTTGSSPPPWPSPPRSLLFGGRPVDGDGLAGLPVPSVLALVAAAPALGAAEAAVELYRQRLTERVLAYTLGDRASGAARGADPPRDRDERPRRRAHPMGRRHRRDRSSPGHGTAPTSSCGSTPRLTAAATVRAARAGHRHRVRGGRAPASTSRPRRSSACSATSRC